MHLRSDPAASDERKLRSAFGAYPTGVAVITAAARDARAGITVNSFVSVSLRPPMVQFSVATAAPSLPVLLAADRFVVHVLAADQASVAHQFARPAADKFAHPAVTSSANGMPTLSDCAAVFECRRHAEVPLGDHVGIVGEVLSFADHGTPPLVFHRGQYAALSEEPWRRL